MQAQWTWDFFVSYNQADRVWAEWIAWQLEENGYKTVLQAWDFRPGGNFIELMHRATKGAERTIAVLSPNYLAAPYPLEEWTVPFVGVQERDRRLVPVRVQKCTLDGLLSTIIYIDLVGFSEEAAKSALLNGVQAGRGKPPIMPRFPGPSSVFPGTLPPVWNIPHNRNLDFIGREDFLADLHTALNSKKRPHLPQVIVGQGGVGKTQIAIEYAFRHAAYYEVVWWLRAEALAADYGSLAKELDLPEKELSDQNVVINSVQDWLGQSAKWLLIFDNVESPVELRNFLPRTDTGHMIITSRNTNWQGLANVSPVMVLEANDAATFLVSRTELIDANN